MAPEIALKAIPEIADRPLTILDPMCGSGTVLAVALQNGHNAIGVDIDPLAVMMSQLTVTPINSNLLLEAAEEARGRAGKSEGSVPWGDDVETDRFADYWFGSRQKAQLIALASAIDSLQSPEHRLALRLALSRIIVTKSPQASLAADTAHSRPHRVQIESDYDVFDGFAKSAMQLSRMLDRRVLKGNGAASLGDARALTSVASGSADLAVTSPPYLNALDYLRGHKLALIWFGFKIAELRKRRGESIGAERSFIGDRSASIDKIVDLIKSDVTDMHALRLPMLERFAHDCVSFAAELRRVIKSDGHAVLVVGNSTLRGNYIRNDLIAQRAMEYAGFAMLNRYEREIPPSRRYMAIRTEDAASALAKRMRTEVVLTMGPISS